MPSLLSAGEAACGLAWPVGPSSNPPLASPHTTTTTTTTKLFLPTSLAHPLHPTKRRRRTKRKQPYHSRFYSPGAHLLPKLSPAPPLFPSCRPWQLYNALHALHHDRRQIRSRRPCAHRQRQRRRRRTAAAEAGRRRRDGRLHAGREVLVGRAGVFSVRRCRRRRRRGR